MGLSGLCVSLQVNGLEGELMKCGGIGAGCTVAKIGEVWMLTGGI